MRGEFRMTAKFVLGTLVNGGVAKWGRAGLGHKQIHFGHLLWGTFGSSKWNCHKGSQDTGLGGSSRDAAVKLEKVWGEKRQKQSSRAGQKNTSLSFKWRLRKGRKPGRTCCHRSRGKKVQERMAHSVKLDKEWQTSARCYLLFWFSFRVLIIIGTFFFFYCPSPPKTCTNKMVCSPIVHLLPGRRYFAQKFSKVSVERMYGEYIWECLGRNQY